MFIAVVWLRKLCRSKRCCLFSVPFWLSWWTVPWFYSPHLLSPIPLGLAHFLPELLPDPTPAPIFSMTWVSCFRGRRGYARAVLALCSSRQLLAPPRGARRPAPRRELGMERWILRSSELAGERLCYRISRSAITAAAVSSLHKDIPRPTLMYSIAVPNGATTASIGAERCC
jgi:hypothetical protein